MYESVRRAILGGRSAARLLARNGVAALLGLTVPADPIVQLADLTRAQVLARSHVLQVERQLLKARAADPKATLRAAVKATEHRAAVLAATETFHAVAEERLRVASRVSLETGVALFKSWNAEGDACPRCREVDGETVGINDQFSIGAEPGMAHAQCRCWVEIATR